MSQGIASRTLQLLQNRATDARDSACAALGKAQETHGELLRACEEVQQERSQPLPARLSGALLQVHAQRRLALEELAGTGARAVAQSKSQLEQHRAAVREASITRIRYQTLARRQQERAVQAAMRLEQKTMDAIAAQTHLRGATLL